MSIPENNNDDVTIISPIPPAVPATPAPQPAPTAPALWSASHFLNQYWLGGTEVGIDRDEGVLQTPICEDPGVFGQDNAPPCGIVQMYAPCSVKRVMYIAQRANAAPEIPQPVPSSSNEILSRFVLKNLSPVISDGKTKIFRVLVQIDYLLVKAPDSASGFPGTRAPYDSSSPAAYNINAGDFDPNAVAPT